MHIYDKFNKVLFSLIAGKIKLDASSEELGEPALRGERGRMEAIHRMIGHVMDSSQPKSFKEYQEISEQLLARGLGASE